MEEDLLPKQNDEPGTNDSIVQEEVIDVNSPETKRWKRFVIAVLCLITLLTVWGGYLIINDALTFIENPLSSNILDDVAILCVLWFVGMLIALAYRFGFLHFHLGHKQKEKIPVTGPEKEAAIENEEPIKEKVSVLKKYVIPATLILILIPIAVSVIIYYLIYFIVFLGLGILPYLVGIALLGGLTYSVVRLSKMVYEPKRPRRIIVFTLLMLVIYGLTLFMMFELNQNKKLPPPPTEQTF